MSAFYDKDEAPAEKKRGLFRRGDKAKDSGETGHQRRVLFSSDQRRKERPAPAPKESTPPPRQASAFYMDDMEEILDDVPDDADEIDDILGAYRQRFRRDDDDR